MAKKTKRPDPTPEQIGALWRFARNHGKGWKDALSDCWMRAGYPGVSDSDAALLHQIRNNSGPSWLYSYDIDKTETSTVAVPRAPRKPRKASFDDPQSVLKEFCREEKEDIDSCEIEEDRGLGGFGAGTVYRIECGNREWQVAKDSDDMRTLAVAVVKQDLESEPELFNQSFIEQHIDLEHLRDELLSDVQSMRYEDLKEDADRDPVRFMKDNDIEIADPPQSKLDDHLSAMRESGDDVDDVNEFLRSYLDKDAEDKWADLGEEPEIADEKIVDLADEQAKNQLKNPIDYLEDIYGREDAVKKAIEIGGIDIDAAAEAAVDEDGPEHFLARYDGNSNETSSGFIYWRTN